MRIVFISDTHQHRPANLPPGDVLVHAGDLSSTGTYAEVVRFLDWFSSQPHPHKIFIAGNHDRLFEDFPDQAVLALMEHPELTYLQDAGVTLDGVRFWGSPWQPEFCNWAFNLPRRGSRIREAWNRIPTGTDVLITHGPPHGVLDQVRGGEHLGCEELTIRLGVIRPRIHVFGHIHDGYGIAQTGTTTYINASTCDETYRPTNRPIVVDLTPEGLEIVGAAPTHRQERLAGIKAILASAQGMPAEVQDLQFEAALRAMAELAGKTPECMASEYVRRGLLADLKSLEKSENRPSRRPIPRRDLKT